MLAEIESAPDCDADAMCRLLKAVADPNRLRIFAILLEGDSCNARLNERLGLAPNLLSHHLSVLRQAGLITDQRDTADARWIYYTVDRAMLGYFYAWLSQFFDPAQLDRPPHGCRLHRIPEGGRSVTRCGNPEVD